MVAVAVVALAGCSSPDDSEENDTLDVKSYVTGQVDNQDGFSEDSCEFYDGRVSAGDSVVIRGSNGEILGKGTLSGGGSGNGPACSFPFEIEDVDAGQSGYSIEVGPYEPLVVSSDELSNPGFSLTARTAMDVVLNESEPPLKVYISGS
ncbi:hypothetical protein SEA_POSH_17 [Gordonia phage Posh]|nr:hypothetical protein SEA_POSH_17 [Gordonia phage Posh]